MSKKPYPKEFRDDVVRVARNREPGVGLDQIAKDFGIHFTTLYDWMKKADIEDGDRPGTSQVQSAVSYTHLDVYKRQGLGWEDVDRVEEAVSQGVP